MSHDEQHESDHDEHEQAEQYNRLIKQRLVKMEQLRELGVNPFRNGFAPLHTTEEVKKRFADVSPPTEQEGSSQHLLAEDRFQLAGRIVEYRSFGKATFVKIADRTGRLQVYVRRDQIGEAAYDVFKRAEMWDFVGVRGGAFFTKTGELTLMAEEVVFLTKAMRPPPEKWSGLRDHETRYRQRYVDLVANPDVAAVFRQRSKIIGYLRSFLAERDFIEVETPILHPILGGAAARPFRTHHNALDMALYLRIAPELYLKRLVVGGFDRVFEIGRNFRNEGLSRVHNPEFTMIEFYMAYATYRDLMELTETMLTGLATTLHGTVQFLSRGMTIDMTPPWPRVSVKEAVLHALKEQFSSCTPTVLEHESVLKAWCREVGLLERSDPLGEALRSADSHGKRIGLLFDYFGEAALPQHRPVFVYDYPAETSPLARRKDDDPSVVERFELFIAGSEVANAFSELNDPLDQRQRFVDQVKHRERGDDEAMEYDEDYCRALEYGMPPTAGQGIGIDRLVMLFCDQPSIRDVLLFPHMRPEES